MDEINPFEFQRVIGRFIEHMGFEIESAKDIEDGSVDFKAKTKNPMGASIISLIRASTYTRLVADDDINSLNEAMGEAGAVRAAYITTSGFSNGAVEAARDKPISLINKYQLMESIEKRGLSSDTDFMESLDKLGMAEKHFQGVEQSFVNGVSESAAKAYFEGKGKRNEKPIRIRLRYAPVSVLKVVTTKDVWTSDQTLRSIEEKDYMFVNLNNLELYFITQRRKRNKTEKTLMRSDIIRMPRRSISYIFWSTATSPLKTSRVRSCRYSRTRRSSTYTRAGAGEPANSRITCRCSWRAYLKP
jgi:hypothetical protein